MNKTLLPFIMGQLRPVAISLLTALMLVGGGSFAEAQKSLPYSYGFEDNNLATDGWTTVNPNTGSLKTKIYNTTTAYTHTGSYHFRFISYEVDAQYLISPELATSATGIEVSFYYRTYGNSDTEYFYVGYSSTDNSTSSFIWSDEESYTSSTYTSKTWNFPTGTKYIAIKTTTNTANTYRYLFIDDITIVALNPYKVPTSFVIDSYDATSATFTWKKGDKEEAFQMQYIKQGDADSTTVDIGNYQTTTLNDLSTGKEYKAKLRSNYGGGHYSEWTEEVTFTPRAEIETTINDGNSTNGYVPFYGSAANGITNSQFIIPSSSLGAVNDRQITKFVFYSYNASKTWGTAQFEVYIKETSNTTFSTADYDSWGTCVFNSASLSVDANKLMTIELSTPYNYQGGNLQIGFKIKKTGSSSYNSFYGVNGSTYTTVYGTGTTSESRSLSQFLPKMTITSVPITTDPVQIGINGFTTFASPRALDLRTANLPDGLTAYKAESVDGTTIHFTEVNSTVAANTGLLLAGTANTTYNIPVVGSGSDISGSNLFLVNSTGGTFSADDGFTYYGLKKATSSSDNLVFATFNPSTVAIPSNKAYLKVSNTEARQLTCVFDDEATGISATLMNSEERIVNSIYNLAGQRVAQPTKGLYIKNGRKVIVK